jgi:hypothetical protein
LTPTVTNTFTPTLTATRTNTYTQTMTPTRSPTPTNTPAGPPTGFRLNTLAIKDPPIFADAFGSGLCLNLTSIVNNLIAGAIQSDAPDHCCTDLSATDCEAPERSCASDGECSVAPWNTCAGDGNLDLNIVVVFRPLNQTAGASGDVELNFAECVPPMASTSCVGATAQTADFTNISSGTCLAPYAGTVSSGTGQTVLQPTTPCFLTEQLNLTFDLAGLPIPLSGVRASATYQGVPATGLSNGTNTGLLRGFMSETTANSVILPPDIQAPFGGQPLSTFLRGSAANDAHCPSITADDRDRACAPGQTNQGDPCTTDANCVPGGVGSCELGWYFYLNFGAPNVPFSDPAP